MPPPQAWRLGPAAPFAQALWQVASYWLELGLGLLPEQAARVLAKGLDLAVRPFSDPWAERRMLLCVRKDRAGMPSVAKLLDFLCDRGHLPETDGAAHGSAS